jgi:RimJ/RimL family protein N-acetyltransferase
MVWRMTFLFETERLLARPWDPERDAVAAFEMYGDPEVTRHIGGSAEPDVDAMRERLRAIRARDTMLGEPFGSFALFERGSSTLAGATLLRPLPDGPRPDFRYTEDIEIGWHLPRRAWGMGYATEAGLAVLARGFEHLEVDRIHAVVLRDNPRSIAVTRRLGMRHVGATSRYYGLELEHFEITREEHEAQKGA